MPFGQSYWAGKIARFLVEEVTGSRKLALGAQVAVAAIVALKTIDPAGKVQTLVEVASEHGEGLHEVVRDVTFGSGLETTWSQEPVVADNHSYSYGYRVEGTNHYVSEWETRKTS